MTRLDPNIIPCREMRLICFLNFEFCTLIFRTRRGSGECALSLTRVRKKLTFQQWADWGIQRLQKQNFFLIGYESLNPVFVLSFLFFFSSQSRDFRTIAYDVTILTSALQTSFPGSVAARLHPRAGRRKSLGARCRFGGFVWGNKRHFTQLALGLLSDMSPM